MGKSVEQIEHEMDELEHELDKALTERFRENEADEDGGERVERSDPDAAAAQEGVQPSSGLTPD